VRSFLQNRTQKVKLGRTISAESTITCGTPAGTKLAPFLYIVVQNYILNKLKEKEDETPNFCNASFVDDLVLAERVIGTEPKLQSILNEYGKWATETKVKPNPSKCEVMIANFGGRKVKFNQTFQLLGETIPVVKSIKLLGVTLLPNTSWDAHVKTIVNKAGGKLFQLRKLHKAGFDKKELTQAYMAYVRSNLEYCSVVWCPGLNVVQAKRLVRVEKKALSIICRRKVDRQNYEEALNECGIQSLQDRMKMATNKFGLQLIQGKYKHFLPSIEVVETSLRSRKGILKAPLARTEFARDSTINHIISLVNSEYVKDGTIFGAAVEQVLDMIKYELEGESVK